MKTTAPNITRAIVAIVVAIVALATALTGILSVRHRVLKARRFRDMAAEVLGEEEFTKIA